MFISIKLDSFVVENAGTQLCCICWFQRIYKTNAYDYIVVVYKRKEYCNNISESRITSPACSLMLNVAIVLQVK